MRKALLWLLAVSVSATLLAGCGKQGQQAAEGERGYYYEGPMKPKSERGVRPTEQAGSQ
ncbi:MAG: hypothetical protein NZ550_06040 [Fimbriimonadales bacterium]|nr:hypothetical protein [Fimbriimonadales bacterium]